MNDLMNQTQMPQYQQSQGYQYQPQPTGQMQPAMQPMQQMQYPQQMQQQPQQQGTSFWEQIFGKSGQNQQFSTLSPQQSQMQQMLLQLLGPQLQQRFSGQQGGGFEPIADQMRQGFSRNTVPTIMERFGGSNSSEASSALPLALGSAGKDLETGIGAMRSQYGMQQNQQLLQLLSSLMQPQHENVYNQRQPGMAENILSAGAQGAGMMLPFMFL